MQENTVVIRSEACETAILGKARWAGRQGMVQRPRDAVEISDEQAAKVMELLQELASLAKEMAVTWKEIEATWAQIARDWDTFARIYTDAVVDRAGDSILPLECSETRCLSRTPCSDTQVDNRPRWK